MMQEETYAGNEHQYSFFTTSSKLFLSYQMMHTMLLFRLMLVLQLSRLTIQNHFQELLWILNLRLLLKEIISFIIKKHIFNAKLLESHVEFYEMCFLKGNNQAKPPTLGNS